MARLETRSITGKSGKEYAFNIYPGNMRFNDFIPGVYYVFKQEGDAESAIFLGESGNVDVTLQAHDKQACFDEHGYNRIGFHMNASQEVRDGLMSDLTPVLSPACND